MSEPLLRVSLAEIRARGVALRAEEAVAIVLQLGDRLAWQAAPPLLHAIVLQSDGRVEVRADTDAIGATAASYAKLLHELLPEPHDGGGKVPGGLRLLVARALGEGGLPIVTSTAFAAALHRFAPHAAADTIVGVLLRWAESTSHVAVRQPDRRRSGPSVSDLRQQLRQSDLDRYALLSRISQLEAHTRRAEEAQTVRVAIPMENEPSASAPDASTVPQPWRAQLPVHVPEHTQSTSEASEADAMTFVPAAYQLPQWRRAQERVLELLGADDVARLNAMMDRALPRLAKES